MSYLHHHHHHAHDDGIGERTNFSGDDADIRSAEGDEDHHSPASDLKGDMPTYLLEHLATFTVNKDSGIVYPSDGMRRLLQLEKTTGIWSQKMLICLEHKWVLIMDYETRNVIERFPASLIKEPTAFTSNDAMELYNNILVFIVSGGANGARSEMHIFQSQSVSAAYLVENLRSLQEGGSVIGGVGSAGGVTNKHMLQNATHHGYNATTTVSNNMHGASDAYYLRGKTSPQRGDRLDGREQGNNKYWRGQQQSLQHQQQQQHHQSSHQQHQSHQQHSLRTVGSYMPLDIEDNHSDRGGESGINFNYDLNSSANDKLYERDVNVLNHCFDDIEKFIARLQHAAAASRELERRRRNRKSKRKDPGEGLLTLRTRPPYEKEFVDIFAKFKLSFNLLAKLKAHIHDPNAPELVHFLFTPLALIVEAASDTYYETQLPTRVVNPVLTREAVNLLINCVTSKETELWRSLGDAWTVPKDQWKEDVGSYHPVFFDGWSPDFPIEDELEPLPHHALTTGPGGNAVTGHSQQYRNQSPGGGRGGADMENVSNIVDNMQSTMDFPTDYDDSDNYNVHPSSMMPESNNAPIQRPQITTELITMQMQNLYSAGSGHSKGGGSSGQALKSHQKAYNTSALHDQQTSHQQHDDQGAVERWLEQLQMAGAKICVVSYPRTANNDKELSVERGEYLEILDDTRKWWKARNVRGEVAHVPNTIVTSYYYGNDDENTPQQAASSHASLVPNRFQQHHSSSSAAVNYSRK